MTSRTSSSVSPGKSQSYVGEALASKPESEEADFRRDLSPTFQDICLSRRGRGCLEEERRAGRQARWEPAFLSNSHQFGSGLLYIVSVPLYPEFNFWELTPG